MSESAALTLVASVAETIAERLLAGYTELLRNAQTTPSVRKEVNDPLWGTVSLSRVELAVLDSPLLQRLRFLRQLGPAHWVYPGAVHTRFEHAIGALYQTQQLIESINAYTGNKDKAAVPISDDEAQLLRLSSLFSHVGHLVFSECAVSELETMPAFASVAREFADESEWEDGGSKEGEDPPFCRVLAHYIVRSQATRQFLKVVIEKCGWYLKDGAWTMTADACVAAAVDFISWALVGRRVDADQTRPQLHELVTGPFDGGTLDELVRNAKFSGIPSVLDVRRLTLKLAVRRQAAEEVPNWFQESLQVDAKQQIWIFGMRASSAQVLNELQLAQVLVSTKVCRHPKVLAVEEMLRSVVKIAGEIAEPQHLLTFLYFHAEDAFIGLNGKAFRSSLTLSAEAARSPTNKLKFNAAAAILTSIRERRVWVRALQLATLARPQEERNAIALDRLRADMGHLQRAETLMTRLCQEIGVVRQAARLPPIAGAALAAQIKMRALRPISAEARAGRAIILQEGEVATQLSAYWSPVDNWIDQYQRGQTTSAYIFSTPEIADEVYVAIKRVAARDYGAEFPQATPDASRRSKTALAALSSNIPKTSNAGVPWAARSRPRVLGLAHTERRIQAVERKLLSVSSTDSQNRSEVLDWLLQFETDLHIRCALGLLEGVRVIDRPTTESAVEAFFKKHPKFADGYVIPFGDLKDGSVLQSYFADANKSVGGVLSLEKWERASEQRPVIFIDDFVGSGGQACDILAAWFGREDLRRPGLNEQRVSLSPAVADKLKGTSIAFLFVAAWDDGLKEIAGITAELNLQAVAFAHLREKQEVPFLESHLRSMRFSPEDIQSFSDRCKEIAADLLRSGGTSESKIPDRLLGYGNKGMLLSTLVNVPTQTLTAIWKSGTVDGVAWKALLPRKPKN